MNDLKHFLTLHRNELLAIASHPDKHYQSYRLPKKKNGFRLIHQPSDKLALYQKVTKRYLTRHYQQQYNYPFVAATGTNLKTNIISNAQWHTNKKHILTIDLTNFYDNITTQHLWMWISRLPLLNESLKILLTALLTYQNRLPQGAPSSPIAANISFAHTDGLLYDFCSQNNITYSRYVDDLTFSSNNYIKKDFLHEIENILNSHGFTINPSKTRFVSIGKAQKVTGLIVNKKVNIPRTQYKQIRAIVHNISQKGLHAAAKKYFNLSNDISDHQIEHFYRIIYGYLLFFKQVKGNKHQGIMKQIKQLETAFDEWNTCNY